MSTPIKTGWLTTENGNKLAPKTLTSQVQTSDGILLEDKIKNDYISSSQKGNANGVAELDSNGKVPTSQLPSYVDDVIEASTKSAFPATGESGKIYVDLATNKTYRWSGSTYIEISASLAIGTTASTAAAGNHGHDNATTSKSGFMSTTDKSKLEGIETGANKTVVDSSLSSSSTNPVQNKVVNSALNNKMNTSNPTGTGSFSMNRLYGSTIGNYSFAEGLYTTASGQGSHSEGLYTTASGQGSHSEGNRTIASGQASHAEGSNTIAKGYYSHAEGNNTIASGSSSHVEGYAANYGFTISGDANATIYSTTDTFINVGYMVNYNGITSTITAIDKENGTFTVDKTLSDIAIDNVEASYLIDRASGQGSHAEGYDTIASGDCSHAEGRNTTASGNYSHAEGFYSTTSGDYSHAEGYYTKASGENQHVQGKYNIEDTNNKYAHIVGNGTNNSTRSNAHTLDWNGNAWYAGTLEATALILSSPNGTRYKITVSDNGTLSAAAL